MGKAVFKVFVFMMVLVGFFLYVGHTITRMTGGERKTVAIAGINPEAGEAIFFGKGKCSTCHSIGDRGAAIRCPNLGVGGEKFPLPIGARAAERAQEREKQTGKKFTYVDYLIECIAEPGAYVVEGYKNEMPYVYKPPISLTLNEVKAVISFLMSQGGDVDLAALNAPPGEGKILMASVEAATSSGAAEEAAAPLLIQGDPEKGKQLFFDLQSNAGCAKCHTVGDQGGQVGPPLTNVAGTRPLNYIMESILDPSAVIASGFEPILIKTKDGKITSGVRKSETEEYFEVGLATGEIVQIPKADVDRSKMGEKSIMPGNFREILSVEEFYDVLAYLQTLT